MGSNLTKQSWVFQKQAFLARELDGETIVMNLKTSDYYTLDGAGSLIFQLICENRTLDQIAAAVADEYDIDAEKAAADALDLIEDLKRRRVIREAGK